MEEQTEIEDYYVEITKNDSPYQMNSQESPPVHPSMVSPQIPPSFRRFQPRNETNEPGHHQYNQPPFFHNRGEPTGVPTGIPPPPSVFHNDTEHFVAYNTGFNAGYVRGYYVAVNNMNNREGQRLHQRYVNRGGNRSGLFRGGNTDGMYRGRGRGGRGGRGGGGNNTFVSPSGQQVQILRNTGHTGAPNVHIPSTNRPTQPTITGDENV